LQVGHIAAKSGTPNMAKYLANIMDYRLTGGAGGEVVKATCDGAGTCFINIRCLKEHGEIIMKHLSTPRISFDVRFCM